MRRGSVYVSKKDEEEHLLISIFMALFFSLIKYGVLIVLPLHLGMFVVGILHRNDCPIDIRIPWYLIFGGAAGTISALLRILMSAAWSYISSQHRGIKYDSESHPAFSMVRSVNYLFRIFIVAWNVHATFHIYSVSPNFKDPSSKEYCHESTFTLAYVLVILFDVFFFIVIIIWLSALIAGIIFPEMIENLYGDDSKDDVLERIDIQLEEDPKTLRQKQRERRRKRKLKQLKPKPKIVKEETSCSHFSNTFGRNYNPTKNNLDLPRFFDKKEHVTDEDSEISSNEDRNLLSSVRFSRLVDSRRISKDYYALLQQSQSQDHSSTTSLNGPPSFGAKRLKELFDKPLDKVRENDEVV